MINIDELSIDGHFSLKDYLKVKHANVAVNSVPFGIIRLQNAGKLSSTASTEESNSITLTDFNDWVVLVNTIGKNSDIVVNNKLIIPEGINLCIFEADLLTNDAFWNGDTTQRRVRLAMHTNDINEIENPTTMPDIWTKAYVNHNISNYQVDHISWSSGKRIESGGKYFIDITGNLPYVENAQNFIQIEHATFTIINFNANFVGA